MMESLNLHTLVNSLPTAQHNAEELTNNFRAAALSITTLYRSSRKNSKRAYNAGYAAACQDLLAMIQQGVSQEAEGVEGLTIGRVMDWIEARVEAIKAREEEEDEEDDKDGPKEKDKSKPVPKKAISRPKTQPLPLPTPTSPRSHPHSSPSPPSPSPPPAALRPIQRPLRPRAITKPEAPDSSSTLPLPDISLPIPITGKRRHAMMMMLDSPANDTLSPSTMTTTTGSGTTGCGSGSGRRRARGSRQQQHQNFINQNGVQVDAMDVEEDGRERKRVARR